MKVLNITKREKTEGVSDGDLSYAFSIYTGISRGDYREDIQSYGNMLGDDEEDSCSNSVLEYFVHDNSYYLDEIEEDGRNLSREKTVKIDTYDYSKAKFYYKQEMMMDLIILSLILEATHKSL